MVIQSYLTTWYVHDLLIEVIYGENIMKVHRYIHSAVLGKKIPQYVALHLILCRSGRLNIFNLKYIPSLITKTEIFPLHTHYND